MFFAAVLGTDNAGIQVGPHQKVQEKPVLEVKELHRFPQVHSR